MSPGTVVACELAAVDSSLPWKTWLALDGVITGRFLVSSLPSLGGFTGSALTGGGAIAAAFGTGMRCVVGSTLVRVRGGADAVGLGGGLGICTACGE